MDTPRNLYENPCNLFVAGFIGSPQMNFLDATVEKKEDGVYLNIGEHDLKVPHAKQQALLDGGLRRKDR